MSIIGKGWECRRSPQKITTTDGKDWPWLVSYNDGEYEGIFAIIQTPEAEKIANLLKITPELLDEVEYLLDELDINPEQNLSSWGISTHTLQTLIKKARAL